MISIIFSERSRSLSHLLMSFLFFLITVLICRVYWRTKFVKIENSSRRFSTDKSATSDLVNGLDLKLADPEILGVSSNTMRRLANCQSVCVRAAGGVLQCGDWDAIA